MYLNYLYCHSFASLEDRFEKDVILSNPFSIDPGRISPFQRSACPVDYAGSAHSAL